jgi:DNA-binding Xre family transcriptional regulator
MLNTDEIKQALRDRSALLVAEQTGVNRNTVSKIKQGHDTNLTAKTMRLLSDYLAPEYKGGR